MTTTPGSPVPAPPPRGGAPAGLTSPAPALAPPPPLMSAASVSAPNAGPMQPAGMTLGMPPGIVPSSAGPSPFALLASAAAAANAAALHPAGASPGPPQPAVSAAAPEGTPPLQPSSPSAYSTQFMAAAAAAAAAGGSPYGASPILGPTPVMHAAASPHHVHHHPHHPHAHHHHMQPHHVVAAYPQLHHVPGASGGAVAGPMRMSMHPVYLQPPPGASVMASGPPRPAPVLATIASPTPEAEPAPMPNAAGKGPAKPRKRRGAAAAEKEKAAASSALTSPEPGAASEHDHHHHHSAAAESHDDHDDHADSGNRGTGKRRAGNKRKKVNTACVYCRRSHMTCDDGRPCQRCIRRHIGHLCHDEPKTPTTTTPPGGSGLPSMASALPDAAATAMAAGMLQINPLTGPPLSYMQQNVFSSSAGDDASGTVTPTLGSPALNPTLTPQQHQHVAAAAAAAAALAGSTDPLGVAAAAAAMVANANAAAAAASLAGSPLLMAHRSESELQGTPNGHHGSLLDLPAATMTTAPTTQQQQQQATDQSQSQSQPQQQQPLGTPVEGTPPPPSHGISTTASTPVGGTAASSTAAVTSSTPFAPPPPTTTSSASAPADLAPFFWGGSNLTGLPMGGLTHLPFASELAINEFSVISDFVEHFDPMRGVHANGGHGFGGGAAAFAHQHQHQQHDAYGQPGVLQPHQDGNGGPMSPFAGPVPPGSGQLAPVMHHHPQQHAQQAMQQQPLLHDDNPQAQQQQQQQPSSSGDAGDRTAPAGDESYLLRMADPVATTIEDRLKAVINAKYEAGYLRPFNYVNGYARLQRYMEQHMSPGSRHRVLAAMARFRPSFRSVAASLTDVDLVLVEETFERLLLDYDHLFSAMGVPACLWRRTGEIYKANHQFADLVGVPLAKLKDGVTTLYELMAEDSAVNYWEKYGGIAFDPGQKAVLTSCLLEYQGSGGGEDGGEGSGKKTPIPCCFSFTIRRDKYNIPIMVVGNFLPIQPPPPPTVIGAIPTGRGGGNGGSQQPSAGNTPPPPAPAVSAPAPPGGGAR
ncbi:Transcription factor [Blastocladiella emersonii ATCC 22665]|nr:Transcription factor [Blastocladiella emersonii ATCC 22665]